MERGGMAPDGSEKNLKASIDACNKILDGKKCIDLFECARVDPKTPVEVTMGALNDYVKEGKIGGISLSECSAKSVRRAAKVAKISAVEVELSLWSTEIFDNGVATACAELDIPIVAYSPLGRGFLTDRSGRRTSYQKATSGSLRRDSLFDKNMELVQDVEKIAKKKGCTPGQLATAWVKKHSKRAGCQW